MQIRIFSRIRCVRNCTSESFDVSNLKDIFRCVRNSTTLETMAHF
jgi:hypothetical protein